MTLILIVLFGIGIFMLLSVQGGEDSEMTKDYVCKLHKWEYDSSDHLICKKCSKRPEEM